MPISALSTNTHFQKDLKMKCEYWDRAIGTVNVFFFFFKECSFEVIHCSDWCRLHFTQCTFNGSKVRRCCLKPLEDKWLYWFFSKGESLSLVLSVIQLHTLSTPAFISPLLLFDYILQTSATSRPALEARARFACFWCFVTGRREFLNEYIYILYIQSK